MATTTYGTPYVSGTDLVANWPAASLTVANSIDQAGYYVGRGTNTQTGSYTLVLTDAGKNITQAVNTANTITIPTNSSVAFPIGTRVNIINLGSGACTPTAAGGVTIAGTITALAINEYASLVKTGTNTWSYLAAATPAAPGLSLVTPTSVAGTGVTLSGGQVTFSAATAASVNGVFTSVYDMYKILINFTAQSAAANTFIRMRVAGTDNASANYYYNGPQVDTSTTTAVTTARSAGLSSNGFILSYKLNPGAADVTLTAPFLTQKTLYTGAIVGVGDTDIWLNNVGGMMSVTTSYDGFTILPASGTITGTAQVYGLRKS